MEHRLTPQLADMVAQLDECSRRARAVVDGLPPEQLARRPAPASWSVAECIAHLTLVNRPFPAALRGAFERLRRDGVAGDGPYRTDLLGRFLAWTLEPPPRFKFGAKPQFTPVEYGPPGRVLPEFLETQEDLKACVREAAGLAIDRVKIVSPVDARAKYNAWAALRVVAAHERRHLWQAEGVRGRIE